MSDGTTVALLAAVGPTLVGLAAVVQATFAKREAAAANRAVNHKEPGEPTLYEHAAQVSERLSAFADYQHDRNHDLLNKIFSLTGRVALLNEALDRHTGQDDAHFAGVKEQLEVMAHTLQIDLEVDELARAGTIRRRQEDPS